MKALLRECATFTFSALGLPQRIHRRGYANCVSIIMYHGVVASEPDVPDWCFLQRERFTSQMDYLARHFDVLPLGEAVARLSEDRVRQPTAVITFDDGFQNNHDVAFPVLKRLGLPFTIYLTTGLVDTPHTVWFCAILDAIGNTTLSSFQWRGECLDVGSARARMRASVHLQQALKSLPHAQLLTEVDHIRKRLGCEAGIAAQPWSPFRMLDTKSIRDLSDSGLVEFGAHTHTHAILSRLPPAQREQEITCSIREVERLTGRACRHFAYPNGGRHDYDGASVALLKALRMTSAVTTLPGPNAPGTDPFALRRYGVGAWTSMSRFKTMIHHALHRAA